MKKNNLILPFIIICMVSFLAILLSSCNGRKANPEKSGDGNTLSADYVELDADTIPFVAEVSDRTMFGIRTADSVTYFCDIVYPETSAHLYCTFRFADSQKIEQLWEEAYKLAGNHLVSSSYIEDIPVSNTYGADGVLFDMGGKAATPYQLALTDGFSYFFNASLYFDNGKHGEDAPELVENMRRDIDKLVFSFRLKTE